MWRVDPEIILGGPGTGKTTYAMDTIDKLLLDGLSPHEISFLSYTRKAVEEARDRAADRFELEDRALSEFRTIHSLCYRETGATRQTMMQYADYRDIARALGVKYKGRADEEDEPSIDGSLDAHLRLHSYARAAMKTDEAAWRELDAEFGWWEHRRFLDVLQEYKWDNDKRDFSDLLSDFVMRPRALPVRAAIIDEAQDLSTLQWRVVQEAFADVERLYVAGDDDQAIYRWSGADVPQFVGLDGTEVVLPHSHRLPSSVHALAQRIARGIGSRREKRYSDRGEEGSVEWLADPYDLPIDPDSGSWMLLARSRYQLAEYESACRGAGIPYRTARKTSMDADHVSAIVGWERLRKGRTIGADVATRVLRYLGRHGPRELPERNGYTMRDFLAAGCTEDRLWHDALIGINAEDTSFYLAVLRNGYSLTREPAVYIGTIHSVKGGEADNVCLLTDISYRSHQAMQEDPDDEQRVFYVGATRAKENLFLVTPQTERYFSL